VTIAEYTKQYIDYLMKQNDVTINDDFALSMRMFGPFNIWDADHMILLGAVIKVILTHAANSIRASSSRSTSSESDKLSKEIGHLERRMPDLNLESPTPASRRGAKAQPQAQAGKEKRKQTDHASASSQPGSRRARSCNL
jgi:hypothetical protein